MTPFTREYRYLVLKLSDIHAALSGAEHHMLIQLAQLVEQYRHRANKARLQTVVIESDWPEYDLAWKAIEARVAHGVPADPVVVVPLSLIQRAQQAINWHLEPNSPDEHEHTMLELRAIGWPSGEPVEKNTTNAPKPAALHYADILDDIYHGISRINASGAAIELRRLHRLTEKLLLEKAQAENSTVMTLTDALSDDECLEVWTRYPEMRNWIQSHAIATPLPIATDWSACQAIADHPEVDEALRLFAGGETTSDQAVAIVQAVLTAVTSKDAA